MTKVTRFATAMVLAGSLALGALGPVVALTPPPRFQSFTLQCFTPTAAGAVTYAEVTGYILMDHQDVAYKVVATCDSTINQGRSKFVLPVIPLNTGAVASMKFVSLTRIRFSSAARIEATHVLEASNGFVDALYLADDNSGDGEINLSVIVNGD